MNHFLSCRWMFGLLLGLVFAGCSEPVAEKEPPEKKSVIGQTTQEIGEFAGGEEENLQVAPNASPIGAPLGAYKYAVGTISKQQITKAVGLFQALEGRYPKDHNEFMEKIIKANGIQLPVLPGGSRYEYDVKNHELKVVK